MVGSTNVAPASPWRDGIVPLIHCHICNALLTLPGACPVCGHAYDLAPQVMEDGSTKFEVAPAFAGALPWSAYALLKQMRIEYERPPPAVPPLTGGPSQHFVVVILCWTLFETLMDRYFHAALADLPGTLSEDLLRRYSSIGARLDRLYRIRWGVSFWQDMGDAGFLAAADHLRLVQNRRNRFIHGDPGAIDDALVDATVDHLLDVQRGWVDLFNRRCTGMQKMVRIWEASQSS